MKQFNRKEQIRFWKGNRERFKGKLVSRAIVELARKYIGARALDVGAGDGSLVAEFRSRYGGKSIEGIDLVPKSGLVLQGDCANLPYPDQSLDTYFATDLIEHLSDEALAECLREANRVLRTGGYAVVSTVNEEDLEQSKVTCPECGCRFHRWGHCRSFSAEGIKRLFVARGFEVVEVRRLNLGMYARFPRWARLFYLFRLERIFKLEFLVSDLWLVARKVRKDETLPQKRQRALAFPASRER